jgi:hypothetical protein
MKLEDALNGGGLPPKAHLVHIALAHLGAGTYSAAELCAVLGYPQHGKYLSRVSLGARQLKLRGLVSIDRATRQVTTVAPIYEKAPKKTRKGAADAA